MCLLLAPENKKFAVTDQCSVATLAIRCLAAMLSETTDDSCKQRFYVIEVSPLKQGVGARPAHVLLYDINPRYLGEHRFT